MQMAHSLASFLCSDVIEERFPWPPTAPMPLSYFISLQSIYPWHMIFMYLLIVCLSPPEHTLHEGRDLIYFAPCCIPQGLEVLGTQQELNIYLWDKCMNKVLPHLWNSLMLSPIGLIIACLDLFIFSSTTLNSEFLKGTNHILFISTNTVCQTLYASRTLKYWKEHWTSSRLDLALPLVE